MLQKEFLEMIRSYKIAIILLIFIVLTVMQPVMFKLLPQLLKDLSDLPNGSVIQIPTPDATTIMATSLGKFGVIGSIVVIIMTMGTIVNERLSGVASLVLVKPIGKSGYYWAKIISNSILVAISMLIAMAITAITTDLLFDSVDYYRILLATLIYIPYLILGVFLAVSASAIAKSPAVAGGIAILIHFSLSFVPTFMNQDDFVYRISPSKIIDDSINVIMEQSTDFWPAIGGISAIALVVGFIGLFCFKRAEN
ncbi:ABC transporter permease [Paenibacillus sp. JCM 10914]|uniref:ABC transporter permease n=1 Tax=Paenibacillus sp. JCM 10914 TaxID=1236974 RepID=UPI000A56070A|nr:ABC transporter permease subunit [Paenibacillus sp. JCM 10914]